MAERMVVETEGRCATCGASARVCIVHRVVRGRVETSRSTSCATCGHQEESDGGFDQSTRALLLEAESVRILAPGTFRIRELLDEMSIGHELAHGKLSFRVTPVELEVLRASLGVASKFLVTEGAE